MKPPNASARDRHSLRWALTAGSIAAALGFWGVFAQAQAGKVPGGVEEQNQAAQVSSSEAGLAPVPTLVPRIAPGLRDSPSQVSRARRPAPVTTTRSSR